MLKSPQEESRLDLPDEVGVVQPLFLGPPKRFAAERRFPAQFWVSCSSVAISRDG